MDREEFLKALKQFNDGIDWDCDDEAWYMSDKTHERLTLTLHYSLEAVNKMERYTTLLRATMDLLKQQRDSAYVLDLLSELVEYDGAECDGNCLLEDIEVELENE